MLWHRPVSYTHLDVYKRQLDEVGEAAGESGKTVQRYIWLARLSDELLELVDRKKIGLVQGVDISFLSEDAQQWVLVILEAVSYTHLEKAGEFL